VLLLNNRCKQSCFKQSSNETKVKFLRICSVAALAVFLQACDGSATKLTSLDELRQEAPSSRTLLNVYPADGQFGVSSSTEIKLDFQGGGAPPSVLLTTADGSNEVVELQLVQDTGTRSVYTPVGLDSNRNYELFIGASNGVDVQKVSFSTEPTRSIPSLAPQVVFNSVDSSEYPLTDRSSVHIGFSEWIDPASVREASVSFASPAGDVDARVMVDQFNASITPLSPLPNAGPWTVSLSGLYDFSGTPMATFTREYSVTPLGSLSRVNVAAARNNDIDSQATVNSTLFGVRQVTLDSETGVYLGDPLVFDGYQPVLIRRGTEIKASSLDLELGGVSATSLSSGPLRLVVLNDAIGYLRKNKLTGTFDVPQSLDIIIDLGVSTSEDRTQAVLTQYELGVRASGLSEVVAGQLEFALSGTNSLGILESGSVSTNLDLVLATVNRVNPDFTDSQAPAFVSAYPENGQLGLETSSVVQLIFDEALDPAGVAALVSLSDSDGNTVPAEVLVNGGKIAVIPGNTLAGERRYTVTVQPGLKDLVGNTADQLITTSFTTQSNTSAFSLPARITGMIPGIACPLEGADLQNNIAGYCFGGDITKAFTVFQLPEDQPVEIWLNTSIEPASAYVASSCSDTAPISVRRVDWSNGTARCIEAVGGIVNLAGNNLSFSPDGGLEVGASYLFEINVGDDDNCDNGELCGDNGLPVEINPLDDSRTAGGGSIVIPFTAVAANGGVYQPMLSRVRTDIDGSNSIDGNETGSVGSSIDVRMDLCNSRTCSDLKINNRRVCASPDAEPAVAGYSCNADAPTTDLDARIVGGNIAYSDVVLPITVGLPEEDPTTGGQRIPVRVPPIAQYTTGLEQRVSVLILNLDVPTGGLVFRFQQNGRPGTATTPIGYISTDAAGVESRFTIDLNVLVDAPELNIPTGGRHNLINRVTSVRFSSLIEFDEQGRFALDLRNQEAIKLPTRISGTLFGLSNGTVTFEVPAGGLKLDVVSRLVPGAR